MNHDPDYDLPDWNRTLHLCVQCGRYTESLSAHFTYKLCRDRTVMERPAA